MLHQCPNCRAETEFEDNVCTHCSLELIEDSFVSSQKFEATTNHNNAFPNSKRPYYLKTTKYDNFAKFLKPMKIFTRRLCGNLKCGGHVLEGSLCWIEKVLRHNTFRKVRIVNKHTICASVVYFVCRSWSVPLTLGDIHRAASPMVLKGLGTWKGVVGEVFKELGRFGRAYTIREMADVKCESLKLGKGCQQRLRDLLGLLEKLWLTEGVGVEGIVVVCCYISWVGEAPMDRWKTSLSGFCRQFGMRVNSTMKNHHTTIVTALTQVYHLLPWNTNNSNNINNNSNNINNTSNNINNNSNNINNNNKGKMRNNNQGGKKDGSIFFNLDDIIKYGGITIEGDDDDDDDIVEDDDDDIVEEDDDNDEDDKVDDDIVKDVGDNDEANITGIDDDINNKNNAINSNNNDNTGNDKDDNKDDTPDNSINHIKDKNLSVLANHLFMKRRWKRKRDDDEEEEDECLSSSLISQLSNSNLMREGIDETDMTAEELSSYLYTEEEVRAIQMMKRCTKDSL